VSSRRMFLSKKLLSTFSRDYSCQELGLFLFINIISCNSNDTVFQKDRIRSHHMSKIIKVAIVIGIEVEEAAAAAFSVRLQNFERFTVNTYYVDTYVI